MKYADPTHPSPEGEVIARAAAELYRTKKIARFLIFVSTVIGGARECDVLTARLVALGVPAGAFTVDPVADTTDAEFEAFARYAREHALHDADAAALAIEAKRGRLEAIAKRSHFFPKIYWAEDVLWDSPDKKLREIVSAWRHSRRHAMAKIKLGLIPMILMGIDPHARLQRVIARLIRHQQ